MKQAGWEAPPGGGTCHELCRPALFGDLPGYSGPRDLGHRAGGAPPLGRRDARSHGQALRRGPPLRPAGGVSHPDGAAAVSQDGGGRAAMDLAEEVQPGRRPAGPDLGRLGRGGRHHRQSLWLPAGREAPLPRRGV